MIATFVFLPTALFTNSDVIQEQIFPDDHRDIGYSWYFLP